MYCLELVGTSLVMNQRALTSSFSHVKVGINALCDLEVPD